MGVIQLENVSKAYGDRTLFRDVTWQLAGRARIGLVGPNGVGKTTLCRVLAGLEAPDTGRVSRARETTLPVRKLPGEPVSSQGRETPDGRFPRAPHRFPFRRRGRWHADWNP